MHTFEGFGIAWRSFHNFYSLLCVTLQCFAFFIVLRSRDVDESADSLEACLAMDKFRQDKLSKSAARTQDKN